MAHEVESMMFVGATPWHGLGTPVPAGCDSETAIRAAGLDWQVACEPLFAVDGYKADTRLIRRVTDRAVLGEVGPDYEPLQNVSAFQFFDSFATSGQVAYETAGSLRGGKRVWILAALNRDPSVIVRGSDDIVKKYLLLSSSHDGSLAVRVGFTPTRVVCANTLAVAHNDGQFLKVKHTKNLASNLDVVRESIDAANAKFELTADAYRLLAQREITAEGLRDYVLEVFSPTAYAKAKSTEKAAVKRAQELAQRGIIALGPAGGFVDDSETKSRVLPEVTRLFESGRGNALPGVRGTLWAAYNAVTEYLQYERRGDMASRMDSLVFGQGAQLSRKALDTAIRLAA